MKRCMWTGDIDCQREARFHVLVPAGDKIVMWWFCAKHYDEWQMNIRALALEGIDFYSKCVRLNP